MTTKRKRRRKKKTNWTLYALLVICAVIIFAAALYQGTYQGRPTEPEHEEAKDYFEVVNSTVDMGELRDNDTLIINVMSFNLKAVGGNATYVVVNNKGYYGGLPVDLGNMTQGEVKWVELSFGEFGYLSERDEKGFPVPIPIFCEEAWGEITIYL